MAKADVPPSLRDLLRQYDRIAIVGGPGVGKTTKVAASISDRRVFHTDDVKSRAWAKQPGLIRDMVRGSRYAIEGVQVARALRKGYLDVQCVIRCTTQLEERTTRQQGMATGEDKIFNDWLESKPGIPVFDLDSLTVATPTIKRRYELKAIDEADRSVGIVASTANPGLCYEWVEGEDGEGHQEEVWESIVGWDLERFSKNGKILWSHNPGSNTIPIGWAREVAFDEKAQELSMRAKFAADSECQPYGDFPGAENIWRAVCAKLLEAVSVGFRRKSIEREYTVDGKRHRDIIGELTEVSFVAVGEDEDALVKSDAPKLDLDDGAEWRFDLSNLLGADDGRSVEPVQLGALTLTGRLARSKAWTPTQVGGIRLPARIARVGVLKYRPAGGAPRSEYRPSDEVSDPESIATLNGAPVIDFFDHTEFVRPEDYKQKAIGHVENARMDGEFVVGDLVINDAETIMKIDAGEREDTSAGYHVREEIGEGSWRGERYDLTQRRIRYNHVALCPPNRGRSGPEVGIRLDSTGGVKGAFTHLGDAQMKVIKLDGKDYEYGSEQHIAKVEAMGEAAVKAKQGELDKVTGERDTLQGRLDAKAKSEEAAKVDEEEEKKKRALFEEEEKKAFKLRSKRKIKLLMRLVRMGEDDEEETDDDEKPKFDARLDELIDKSERELMLEAIRMTDEKFDDKGRSDDYIEARFDAIEIPTRGAGTDPIVRRIESLKGDGNDPLAAAEKRMRDRNQNAWKPKTAQ